MPGAFDSSGWTKFRAYCKTRGLLRPLQEICARHYVTLQDAYSLREMSAVNARSECWVWLVERGRSHAEVGKMWGRDHTTVLVSIKRFHERKKATASDETKNRSQGFER